MVVCAGAQGVSKDAGGESELDGFNDLRFFSLIAAKGEFECSVKLFSRL